MKFTEHKLETTFIELLSQKGYTHSTGVSVSRASLEEVLIEDDLRRFLLSRYKKNRLTEKEVDAIILHLKLLPTNALYESNKQFIQMLSDGFILQREDPAQKDIYIELIDYKGLEKHLPPKPGTAIHMLAENIDEHLPENNIYRFVNQMEIMGSEKRIPDGIIYVNGLPLVVFEFKTTIEENTTIYDAYKQLTVRYRRDIPELFKYNAFCVISDGVNSKAGSFFAPYEFYYAWRRVAGFAKDVDGIDSMFTMIEGMFDKKRFRDILRNFIFFPDTGDDEKKKIICSYPQYYATRALFKNIKQQQKPHGSGKGGTYFGATGSGKSFTMLFLTRLLMKSEYFATPTIVLITDRTDLDEQLSEKFVNAKKFIGDDMVESVISRADLREKLENRRSGGVFLTTIQKFNEDTDLLSDRSNIICISDEAHRTQINLDHKIRVTEQGVIKSFGFAKHLHNSLPNATYVGFTGTPIDATLDVFGPVEDAYTMTESVSDGVTVRIVYEGRAAKVALDNIMLEDIERYYEAVAEAGANEFQIEQSKKETAKMNAILGDPKRLQNIAEDFIEHYEKRVSEKASLKGKVMFVCCNREIAYALFKRIIKLRPKWNEIRAAEEGAELSDEDKKKLKPIERIKMVMTRSKDDEKELWDLLGTEEYRKELARQFKNEKSNFKIAIVVDMWITGFDVPVLDTIYIDKPIQKHNLIQTISRVNRRVEGKNKGLVVDYIGIKKKINEALAQYDKIDSENFEDISQSLVIMRNHLDLLKSLMHTFDDTKYFNGSSLEQLNTLNMAAEFVQQTKEKETRFIGLTKRLKAAYDICVGSEQVKQVERDYVHFYLAVRSIIFKLTKGDNPDVVQMNNRVREMIEDALQSNGVEEILKIGEEPKSEQDLFDEAYLAKINKIKLPNTKIKLLQKLLAKAIGRLRKVNRIRGIDFSRRMQQLVDQYNDRSENDILRSEVYEEMAEQLTSLIWNIHKEFTAGEELGIDFEEKAFYDILKELCIKYDFTYPNDKMILLAKKVKELVDSQARYPDWNKREDIKASLKAELILLLDEYNYPPVERDEVYLEIFEQAESFKKNRS